MALRLRLRPNERVIIGGAAIRNGDGRSELLIDNEVPVLRESDILSPSEVHTPCERIYLALQLMYVDAGQISRHLETFQSLVADVRRASPGCRRLLGPIEESVAAGRFYQALKKTRSLLEHERRLMSNVQ